MKNKLVILLLGLLGLSAGCSQRDEYGSPYTIFTAKGKVTDTKGAPIPGIKVSGYNFWGQTQTSADGTYEITARNGSSRETIFTLTDTDGPENGGDFAEKQVEVQITKADRIGDGDGRWCEGEYAKTVDVTLEVKQE